MDLQRELGLRSGFVSSSHEAVLRIYYTASRIRKKATEFFRTFEVTDVQFNVLMLLKYQTGEAAGLAQVELSRMMLVNRANITSVIDRMERDGLVERCADPEDRRCKIVCLTKQGREQLEKAQSDYAREVEQIMSTLSEQELRRLVGLLERIRSGLEP